MKRRQAYAVICALSLFTSVISGVTAMAEPETQAVEQSETLDESAETESEQSESVEGESEEETEGETEVFIDHPEARISIPYDQPEAWGEIAMTNDDTVETGINLRDKKDEEGEVLGFLYHGCAVWVLNKGEEWSEVYSGGMTGYVKNEYLTFGDEAKGLGEHYGVDGVTASWDGVNVYAAPDGESEVVKIMNTGDDMVLLEDNGHWLTVKLDAKNKAYVSEDDVVRVLLINAAMPKDGIYKDEVVEESTEEEYTETEEYIETEAPQTEAPQTEAPQTEPPQTEAPQTEPPQTEAPQTEPPQTEAPQTEPPQTEAPQTEPPQTETDDTYYEEPTDTTDPSETEDGIYYEDPEDGNDDVGDIDDEGYYDEESGEMVGTQKYDSQGTAEEYYDADTETEAYVETSGTTDGTVEAYSGGTDTSAEAVSETEAYAETSAQETASASTDDATLLASLIYCEAGNQSYEGMVAVGAVVMNRVNSSSYPDSVSDVIYQSGQFTPASSGSLSSAIASGVPSTCYEAANAALNGEDPTGGATYFNTGSGSGTQIGDHQFY